MLNQRLIRTSALLGEENLKKIQNTSVMIIGTGAVGGYALEMISRLGFGKIILLDFDIFEESNINRQILATSQTIGMSKVEVAKTRINSINQQANVIALNQRLTGDNLDIINKQQPNFIIDAIDDVVAKTLLLQYCVKNQFNIISSMGAALKTNPKMLEQSTLDKTHGCNLAKKLRDNLRKLDVDLKQIKCVYSPEKVNICKDENGNNILGSLPLVPACMGIYLANIVLEETLNK